MPAEASGADLSGANLTNARLSGAMAIHTDFTDAVMRGCKLVRATMRGANFSGSNLEGADLSGADLRGACLRGAVLTGATMTMTELTDADMGDALTDKPVGRVIAELGRSLEELLADHIAWVGSGGARGTALDLSGFDLRHAPSLAHTCLTMLRASGATLYGLDLTGVQLQAAVLDGADMRGCNMTEGDLRGVNLRNAKLNNANLRRINLRPLVFDEHRSKGGSVGGQAALRRFR